MTSAPDVPRAIEALSAVGYRAGIVFSHWLAKVHHGEHFIEWASENFLVLQE